MILVYVLDLDFDPKSVLKKTDESTKIKSYIFRDRQDLKRAIKKEPPDILLFDLYSKMEDSAVDGRVNGQSDDEGDQGEENNSLEPTHKDITELSLSKMQKQRNRARWCLEADHYPTGIHDMRDIINSRDISISFPVAIFSRYGRHLISTENMLEVQKLGGYFVWKDKTLTANIRYSSGFTPREVRSIYDVIKAYESNIFRLSTSLYIEKEKIKQLNQKLKFNFCSKSIEFLFAIFVLFAGVIHGEKLFNPNKEVLAVVKLFSDILSFTYLSPLMILTAFVYMVIISKRSHNVGLLLEAHSYTTSLINDLAATRSSQADKNRKP
ncbi:MAG: hypothetical protein GY737_25265 [Desulfobacteraceae bacterium]|nr:hypothetical protein [Desulfobacteraceae bacterium]